MTLLQRSPTYVMSLTNGIAMVGYFVVSLAHLCLQYYASYKPTPDAPPIEVVDRLRMSMPMVIGQEMLKARTKQLAEQDKGLIVSGKLSLFEFKADGMDVRMH